ncbi:MAG TPA: hypothetical protein VN181_09255 [Thermoanaerobaculia bacterium]|nr:hypothetical protein [Thermoanaerobaculia bacterium]
MKRIAILFVMLIACERTHPAFPARSDAHVTAAAQFTKRYASSPLAAWNVHGIAAGADCAILLVETPMILEDSMVEALHYGEGAYGVYDGGVRGFYERNRFRGVAYKDASGRVWVYGSLNASDTAMLPRCQ